MLRILAVILFFAVIGFFSYRELGTTKPLTPREALDQQIAQVVKAKEGDLSPEDRDLFKLQMAVLDFTTKNSHPPDSLTQLVPVYFDELPINPQTNEVYRYQRKGNRHFLGAMVDRMEGKVVAKKTGKKSGSNSAALLSGDEFVNPNEMELEKFVYDSTNKRDPFAPFDMSPKKSGDGILSELEQFALGQLRLTAVLKISDTESTAIVETAEGRGYPVRPGTKIGTNSGVVVSIEDDRLKILETTVNFAGEEEQKVQELILQVGSQNAVDKKKSKRRRR